MEILLYIVCKNVKWTEKQDWWCSMPVASWTIWIFLFLQPEHNGIHKLVTKSVLCCDWRGLNWLYDKTCQWGGGAPSDIWQCNYMVTSRDNTGTRVASDIVYIETTSPDQDINRKELYYCCRRDRSRLPQLIPWTNWNLLLSEEDTFLRFSSNRKQTQKRSSSVSLNPNNPVLINSTIKFVCLNDRQDVEIRMLCGYWIVWEQDQVAGPDSIAILFVLSILCALRLRRILSIV